MCSFCQTTSPFAVAPAEPHSVCDRVLALGTVIQPVAAWCWPALTPLHAACFQPSCTVLHHCYHY